MTDAAQERVIGSEPTTFTRKTWMQYTRAICLRQPNVAKKLSRACQAIKNHILNPGNGSALTGWFKRRVVLD